VPGFITDVAGLLLLAPPVRSLARAGVRRATERRISAAAAGQVFGPRFVRAKRGESGTAAAEPVVEPDVPAQPGTQPVLEGEIVDPRTD
jgi:UPF0716 protein FxsA